LLTRFVSLAFAIAPAIALAQAEPPPVSYPKLVAQGPSAEAFAPAGWRVEFKIAGDLNKDGIDDLALVIRQNDPKNVLTNTGLGVSKLDTNPRILAVVFGKAGGGYTLVLENHTLIPRTTEPNLDDYLAEGGGIAIKRGTLQVTLHLFSSAGGWGAGNRTFTFRFQTGRFALIGYDATTVQRNTGKTNDVSVNYLTGKMKLATGSIENDKTKVRWRTLPKRPFMTVGQVGDGMEFDPAKPQNPGKAKN
jgi:hypothetical protein